MVRHRALTPGEISTHSLTKRLTGVGYFTPMFTVISTHSLTKRLTGVYKATCKVISISTHSLTKRLTDFRISCFSLCCHFNSQPHEEADIYKIYDQDNRCYFNSQPHEEADRHFLHLLPGCSIFQLTASRRG